MNFSLPSQPEAHPARTATERELPPRERPVVRKRGGRRAFLVLAALAIGGTAVAFTTVPGLGTSLGLNRFFGPAKSDVLYAKAVRGRLPVTVVERGSLESSSNLDALNEVEGSTTIIKILPEGTPVKKGDLVCELDSANLRDQLINQEISTKRAEADLEQAKKTEEVAQIAVKEYLEGTFPQDIQSAEGQIKLAESDLIRSQERLEWSDRMLQIGYVTSSQNQADRLTLQKAEFTLRENQTKKAVLEKYTKDKQMKELQANVEKAKSDRYAKESTYDLEKTKQEKLAKQIDKCKLFAPGDGLIVYANEQGRFGSNQAMIEEGAAVRERQRIFSLPDISKMQVNTKVHESMVDRIRQGLKSRIRVDAFPQQQLDGTVKNIQPLPDANNFFSSDIKVYTTIVTIDNGHSGLRPGMTAQVEILVSQLEDVLSIPVQAILEYKGKDYVYVRTAAGPVRKEVKLGTSNDKLIEIKEGLTAGEEVALSPGSLMTDAEKREAFSVSVKGGGKGEWSAEAVKAGNGSPGAIASGSAEAKKDGEAKKGARKGAGGGGMMGMDPALTALFQKVPAEDRRAMFTGSADERAAILKKAGATDDQIAKLEAAMAQMRERMQSGGFGGGPPGGGGFGGGGGGGGRPGGGGGGPRP
jgi:RND family efflux transporter MFP subunit